MNSTELFTRHPANPILTAADLPYPANTVFNGGVARVDGETLMLVRVEGRNGVSHLAVATSADGVGGWAIDPTRSLLPQVDTEDEQFGVEDPRISRVGDEWLIAYTGYSRGGPLVCLAATRDFRTYDRRGVIFPPEDKDAAIFPGRIDGRYAVIHRPVPRAASQDIWLSWSPDLVHWAAHTVLLQARGGPFWDGAKIGIGPPPLLTDAGWLLLFHGVKESAAGSIYRLGLALLDAERPDRVLARADDWVFAPEAPYERVGDVDNVVFPCGWLLDEDGDTVSMYYGAADTSMCLATASLSTLLAFVAG